MNNKGQVLVVFIILIPILFMLIGIIFDVCYAAYEKGKIENNLKYILKTSLENDLSEYEIEELIDKNIDNIENYNISFDNNALSIYIDANVDGVFRNLFDNPIEKISVLYKGYVSNDKIVIERG